MADLGSTIRTLLLGLSQAGAEAEAKALEGEFVARGWQVGPAEFARVVAALDRAATATNAPEPPPTSLPSAVTLGGADRWSLFSEFAPWVETLPGAWQFLEDVERLLASEDLDALAVALSRLFVDHIGYEPKRIEETGRLDGQSTLSRVVSVASHGDFSVMAVESKFSGPYTTSTESVFRLHPRALVFELATSGRVRAIARKNAAGEKPSIASRVVRGRRAIPEDDIFVWARRIALMEPSATDDGRVLSDRAHLVLERDGLEVAKDWKSRPVDPRAIPGPTWERSASRHLERFLHDSAPPRAPIGLASALRSSFPWNKNPTPEDPVSIELRYVSHTVESTSVTAHEEVAGASDHFIPVRIALELRVRRDADATDVHTVPLDIPAKVIAPRDDGVFILRGRREVFVPSFDSPARVLFDEDDDEDTGPRQDVDGVDLELAGEGNDPVETRSSRFRGASLDALLTHAVSRKLGRLGVAFSKTRSELLRSPALVRAFLLDHSDARGLLEISARSVLTRHLRAEAGGPRWVAVAPDSLPSWACMEVSSRLPVARAYPVQGARIGPAGALFAPRLAPSGSLHLSAQDECAFTTNARVQSRPDVPPEPWIASGLTPWAGLPVGAVEDPLGFLVHESLAGPVLRVAGSTPVLRVDASRLPDSWSSRTWTFDVPSHPANRAPPRLLVAIGTTIEAGTPILAVPRFAWPEIPMEGSHHLEKITQFFRTGERRDPDSDLIVRCPPGIAGVLKVATSAACTDRYGTVLLHRVTFITTTRSRPTHCMLRDGRTVQVVSAAPENLPYRFDDGSNAVGVLEDPQFASVEPTLDVWLDGLTGDALAAGEVIEVVELATTPSPAVPDVDLRYRVVDGLGEPRSEWDAALEVRELRLLRAASHPSAAAVDRASARVAPYPPQAFTLFGLAVASHVSLPPLCPSDWRANLPSSTVPAQHDPMRTNVWRRVSKEPDAVAPAQWACTCGNLRGSHRCFETCTSCDTRVELRRLDQAECPWPAVPLLAPIFHPWRRDTIAALLGLTRDELDSILHAYDGSELVDAVESACLRPERSLVQRIRATNDPKLAALLARGFEYLEPVVMGRIGSRDLILSELRLLPHRLRFDGYRFGSPQLVSSVITERYRVIQSATEQVEIANSGRIAAFRRAAWLALQRAVDDLFGRTESPSEGTLAELWMRAFPTTCSASARFAVPGLYDRCDAALAQAHGRDRVFGCSVPEVHAALGERDSTHRGILTADGHDEVRRLPEVRARPREREFWAERVAWSWFADAALVPFAAIILGSEGLPQAAAHVAHLRPIELEGEPLGPFVLREWVLGLRAREGRPSELRRLLDGPRPINLPMDSQLAEARLAERLGAALPGDSPGAALARAFLVRVLSSFFHGSPSAECPLGWMFDPPGLNAPTGYRRAVPRLSDAAWRAWPGYRILAAPLEAAAVATWDGLTRAQAAWLGLGTYLPPDRWWSDDDAPAPHAAFEAPAEPLEGPSPAHATATVDQSTEVPDLTVRVLTGSVMEWVNQHFVENAHADRSPS